MLEMQSLWSQVGSWWYTIFKFLSSKHATCRTGDRECPMWESGNLAIESQRRTREDPMAEYAAQKDRDRLEKYERVQQLKLLVEEIRSEERERKRLKHERKESRRSSSGSKEKSRSKDKRKHSSDKHKKDKKDSRRD